MASSRLVWWVESWSLKREIHMLIPRTCEYYLEKRIFVGVVKGLTRRRSSWIIPVGLKSSGKYLCKSEAEIIEHCVSITLQLKTTTATNGSIMC